jgi:outer membrane protein TolC
MRLPPTTTTIAVLAAVLSACGSPPKEHRQRLDEYRTTLREWERVEPTPITADSDLEQLLQHAARSNPGLRSAFERWHAALEDVSRATALPEPRLTFAGYLSEVETRVGPMQARIGIVQPIPWFGKLDAAAAAAYERAEAARQEVRAEHLALQHRVRNSWYETFWLERAIEITAGHRELLHNLIEVALARFESGEASHADVLRTQVELGELENRLHTLEDLRRPLDAELNAALGRAPDAILPSHRGPPSVELAVDGEALQARLATTNPRLLALHHRAEAAAHVVELAHKEFYPDLAIGADYTFIGEAPNPGVSGSGDDAFALSLGLELPIWRSAYAAGLRAAEAREVAARGDYEEQSRRLAAELEMALYELHDADRRVGLYLDTLIPKGEESFASLDAGYRAGEQGFLDLIDAERALLEFQLQAARAQADRAQALAEILRIAGTPPEPEL